MKKGQRELFDRFPAGKSLQSVIESFLKKIHTTQDRRFDEIVAAWNHLVGKTHGAKTKVIGIEKDSLIIQVASTGLRSVLVNEKKDLLLQGFQQQYPSLGIKRIIFRI